MSYGVDFPNISANLYTSVDPYVATGTQTNQTQWPNGALNSPGSVWQMPVQPMSQYAGFSYAPVAVITGTTHTNTVIDSLTSTSGLFVGMVIAGAGITAGTTIATITSATAITTSVATTASATVALAFSLNAKNTFNGFPPIVKYVRYNSTANPSLNAYPSVVYYSDESGTTVTGVSTEAQGGAAAGAVNLPAGILLYNSTASGLTGAASATALNGNWCWIQVGGLCPAVAVPSASTPLVGSSYITAAGNFLLANQAAGTNAYPYFVGTMMSQRTTANTADLLVNPLLALL